MSNRKFEMHEYRQIIARMRLGDTDRAIARTGLMGRKKAARIREIALAHSWLNTEKPLPDEADLASVFPRTAEEPSLGSLVVPYAQEVKTWHQEASGEQPSTMPWYVNTVSPAAIPPCGGTCRECRIIIPEPPSSSILSPVRLSR